MSHTSKHIHCDNCDTLTKTKLNKIELYRYGRMFQFADAVTETCPSCGEIYVPASTLKTCEKIMKKELVAA